MKNIKTLAAVGAFAVVLGGCAIPTQAPEPAPTVTVTSKPTPAPTVTVTEEPLSASDSEVLGNAALAYVWSEMSYSDQEDFCTAYNVAPDYAWSELRDSASDVGITRQSFNDFFQGVC